MEDELPPDTILWRRISEKFLVTDGDGNKRPSSQAFQNLKDNMFSVHNATIAIKQKISPQSLLVCFGCEFMASISVELAISSGQSVVAAPEPDDPTHTHVIGEKNKPVRRKFAKSSDWVLAPPTVDLT